MTITPQLKDILSRVITDEDKKTITLTGQLDRKDYVSVNEILTTIGFTWNKKAKAHIGSVSPNNALQVILGGNTGTITTTLETKKEVKKKFQQFYTPDGLADTLVQLAGIKEDDIVLEPSAGNGQIVKAIQRAGSNRVFCFEISEESRKELDAIYGVTILGNDFITDSLISPNVPMFEFNRILMNPPFQKHQDITHVKHAYGLLAEGGRLVSIMSCHPFWASHKVDKEFREWLNEVGAIVEDVEAGAFSESGTEIPTKIVIIDK